MGNGTTMFLPSEIIVDILVLLPLDSVLACKLVSKEWKNLIEDSNFIKLYKADSTTFFLDEGVLSCIFQGKDKKSYESRLISKYIETYANDDYFKYNNELLLESSNKIACVKTSNAHFLLYNLLSRDLRVVVDAPVPLDSYSIWLFYGFGYDPFEDDYKIIVLCNSKLRCKIPCIEGTRFDLPNSVNKHDTKRNLIFVYSYKNGCWKHTEGFEDSEYEQSVWGARGFAVNGVLHWIVTKSNYKRRIIGIDLNSYRLAEFKLPPICHYEESCAHTNLTAFKGQLCCFVDGAELDLWVKEEYGVAKSWKLLVRIGRSGIDTGFNWWEDKDIRVYEDRDSGEIVVFIHNQYKYKLFGYDVRKVEKQVCRKTL